MKDIVIKVKRLDKDLEIPRYITETDVGFDLRAAEDAEIKKNEQKIVKCGIVVEIPKGFMGFIKDRAGIVSKMNVHVVAGTIDSGYRGEVSVVLVNLGKKDVLVEKGMRIAQMIILPVVRVKIEEVESLTPTKRGSKGFGSTGLRDITLEEFEEIEKGLKELYEEGKKKGSKE